MNVRELFSNISGTYDLLNRVLSLGRDQKWRKKGVSLLPRGKDVKILDLACGTLDMSLQYLRQGEGEVYGVDFSLPMLLTGQLKVSPTLDQRLHLILSDGQRLPFPSQFFDACCCAFGVRNFSNLALALNEIRRVLKPGGQFLVLEFFRPKKTVTKIFSKTYRRYVIPTLGRWISKDKQAYDYFNRSIEGFLSLKEYTDLLEQTGFHIEMAKDLTAGISSVILSKAKDLNGDSE